MTQRLVLGPPAGPLAPLANRLPPMTAGADDRTAWRFVDFFAVTIRNPNTREAYYRAVSRFMDWCEMRGIHRLDSIRPIHVAAYVEHLPLSRPSVRQHLSAISRCFDWLVSGGSLEANPATTFQRPRHRALDVTRSRLKGTRMNRQIVFQMIRRRARRAGLPPTINCHSFRATGITNYLSNGGGLEDARAIAAHESSQTTRLYDRTGDRITPDEIERIRF